MEIKVLENEKNRLVFELLGGDHTLCNAIKKDLIALKDVQLASYAIEHPQVGIPKMVIETTGKLTPKKALEDAIKNLKAKNKDFLAKFTKIVK